ncbi:hypothetical protein TTY48_19710 [Tsukamurella sp. TY48]|nr:hypothetical protein TTY48_19710 [Tsukamurella sp. TY48]
MCASLARAEAEHLLHRGVRGGETSNLRAEGAGAILRNETKLQNVRFWWPRREFSPEAVAALLHQFLAAGAGAEAIHARWFFGGDTRAEGLTNVAFDLQNTPIGTMRSAGSISRWAEWPQYLGTRFRSVPR